MIRIDYNTLLDIKEREEQAALAKRPRCSECGERIEDETCYKIRGWLVCEHCMDENHRVWVDDEL